MASDLEFSERARKVLSVSDRLNQMREGGRISQEDYAKKREVIERHLSALKAEQSGLIDQELAGLQETARGLESQRDAGLMSQTAYGTAASEISKKVDELTSERQMLDLAAADEYAKQLRRQLDAGMIRSRFKLNPKQKSSGSPQAYGAGPAADEVPMWVWLVYAFLIGYPIVANSLYASPIIMVLYVVSNIIGIFIGAAALHVLTTVVGIRSASVCRAITCGALMRILAFVAGIVLALPILFVAYASAQLAALLILPFLLVSIVTYFAIAIYSIRSIYAATNRQAAAVILLAVFLALIIAGVLALLALPYLSALNTNPTPDLINTISNQTRMRHP